jgi:hypothetical protein
VLDVGGEDDPKKVKAVADGMEIEMFFFPLLL